MEACKILKEILNQKLVLLSPVFQKIKKYGTIQVPPSSITIVETGSYCLIRPRNDSLYKLIYSMARRLYMKQVKILVVDGDKEIADLVEIHLVSEGYLVRKAHNAREGFHMLETGDIKLVILDTGMPDMDGLSICRKIRETSTVPIIMISARASDLDKILGLGAGADDFVTKPFSPLELTARVKAQLRRYIQYNPNSHDAKKEGEIVLGQLTINKDTHRVTAYGKEVKLTPIEFDILYLLASNAGKVFSTDDIFERVWNERIFEANNTVMVHIRRIREKIEMGSPKAQIIKTVWGVGYKIEDTDIPAIRITQDALIQGKANGTYDSAELHRDVRRKTYTRSNKQGTVFKVELAK